MSAEIRVYPLRIQFCQGGVEIHPAVQRKPEFLVQTTSPKRPAGVAFTALADSDQGDRRTLMAVPRRNPLHAVVIRVFFESPVVIQR